MNVRTVSLKDYSSLRTGGEGSLVTVTDIDALQEALGHAKSAGLRAHILGGGTNSYFGEDLSKFLFIKLDLKGVIYTEVAGAVIVTAQASEVWDELVEACVALGLWGIENLSYIPGTVGAAPVQNIGAYGVELAEVFQSLTAYDTEDCALVTFGREECKFGYRDSIFKFSKGRYVIVSVTLALNKEPHPVLHYKPLDVFQGREVSLQEVRDAVIGVRTKKLPDWKEHPNAGSFFKNPIVDVEVSEYLKNLYPEMPMIQVVEGFKIPAAWLIEHVADMKGFRVGDIGTWPTQPLVIVNYGSATADDIDALAKEIRNRIHEKTGIILEQEVNRVG
jgi:UDP-N-acetylmuramate dehydrogenase